jgi:hypothetical protein
VNHIESAESMAAKVADLLPHERAGYRNVEADWGNPPDQTRAAMGIPERIAKLVFARDGVRLRAYVPIAVW